MKLIYCSTASPDFNKQYKHFPFEYAALQMTLRKERVQGSQQKENDTKPDFQIVISAHWQSKGVGSKQSVGGGVKY